jgi:hypothetical protein
MAVRLFPAGPAKSPSRLVVALVATGWWLAQPPMVWFYYNAQLHRGAFPPDGDTIIIPIVNITILWALATPFVAAALVAALWRYQAAQSYAAFDSTRRLRSVLWSVLVGLVALIVGEFAYYDVRDGYPLLALAQVPALLVLAWVRSSLCASRDRPASTILKPAM